MKARLVVAGDNNVDLAYKQLHADDSLQPLAMQAALLPMHSRMQVLPGVCKGCKGCKETA